MPAAARHAGRAPAGALGRAPAGALGRSPARPASIKVRALQWLGQREHSRSELRDKLLRLLQRSNRRPTGAGAAEADADADAAGLDGAGLDAAGQVDAAPADPAAEVETLLLWLEEHGYLSQARFIESRINARQGRYGNLRIRQELKQHGVALDAEGRQALQLTEFDRAKEVWRKKFDAPAADAAERVRQIRFLAGRGFSLDVVQRVVRLGGTRSDDDAVADDGPV